MNLLEAVLKLKALKAALAARDLVGALTIGGELMSVAATLVAGVGDGPYVAGSVDEIDAAVAELDAFGVEAAVAAVGDLGDQPEQVGVLDLATILTLLSLAKTIAALIKRRRS